MLCKLEFKFKFSSNQIMKRRKKKRIKCFEPYLSNMLTFFYNGFNKNIKKLIISTIYIYI